MFKPALPRRRSRQIRVGNVAVGGDAPISVQTMTNTETCDVAATVAQIGRAAKAGADIVRVSVPSMAAAEAFGEIRKRSDVPLVADIHFDYRIALRVAELGADCLRVNPGNIGREDRVRAVVQSARDHGIPIRIGVNAGSLEKDLQKKYGEPTPQALVESALRHIDILDRLDFQDFKVSLKASDVFLTVEAYKLLAGQIEQPLHLGITEAGSLRSGSVKSAIGLGMLLAAGIGDTIRLSGQVQKVGGAARQADVGVPRLARPVHHAAQHGYGDGLRHVLQARFQRVHRFDHVELLARAGGAGDDVHPLLPEVQALQDVEPHLHFLHRIGGGDPAAVTAAIDQRIAAVVPFTFGESMPELCPGGSEFPRGLAEPGWGS